MNELYERCLQTEVATDIFVVNIRIFPKFVGENLPVCPRCVCSGLCSKLYV